MSSRQDRKEDKPAGLPCPNSSGSFWHSEPNPFLLGHRSTSNLPEEVDIVIVGSGITGASVARFLTAQTSSQGLSICMLEAREVCWGATGRNGGHCQPLLFDRSPDVADFEVRNVHSVKSYIEENAVDCEWRSVSGCRTFWGDGEALEVAKKEIENLRQVYPKLAQQVKAISWDDEGAKELFEQNKVLADGRCKGITLTEGAGQLWPYKYVTAVIEKAVKQGKINLQTNTPVTSIEAVTNPTTTTTTKDSPRQKVTTPRGTISAKHVILATNGYTSHLLHDFTNLIVPVRCEMSALHPPTGSARLPNSYGMVGYGGNNPEHDDYLIQRPFYTSSSSSSENTNPHSQWGGHLMFGGGRSSAMYNCIGETADDIVDPGEAAYLRKSLLHMLDLGGDSSNLSELKASHQWTGIKGYSRDNMPWVGKVPRYNATQNTWEWEQGLWLCAGYTGHGMPNATLCGKAVVDMILAEERSSTSYEDMCEQMVKAQDLPRAYVITTKRLEEAMNLPTVREQEEGAAAAAAVGGHVRQGGKDEMKKQQNTSKKCAVM